MADWLFLSLRISFGTLIVYTTEPDRCDSVLDSCRSYGTVHIRFFSPIGLNAGQNSFQWHILDSLQSVSPFHSCSLAESKKLVSGAHIELEDLMLRCLD